MEQVPWARDLARRLLAEPLPRRWAHTQGVGRKAESIAQFFGDDAEILVCAAWLHDIGYSPSLTQTRFHPLDGARYLRHSEHADDRISRLVAYHSGALFEASHRGLTRELSEFDPLDGPTADAVTYCDMTTSPDGEVVTATARLAEIASRYGPDNLVTRSIAAASPMIEESVRRVNARIETAAKHQPGRL